MINDILEQLDLNIKGNRWFDIPPEDAIILRDHIKKLETTLELYKGTLHDNHILVHKLNAIEDYTNDENILKIIND